MSSFYLDSEVLAAKRLSDPRNILNNAQFKTIGQGQNPNHSRPDRKPYKKLSPETKGLVGALAKISGVKETAKAFDIQPATVGSYSRGKTSDGINPDPEVKANRDSVLDSIRSKASNVVSESLEQLLNPGRIAEAKTTEIATIAGIAMSIVDKATPKGPGTFIAGNVVFMTPPVRHVQDYLEIESVPMRD